MSVGFCYSARHVGAAPAAMAGVGGGPRAAPPRALPRALAAVRRPAPPPAGPAGHAVLREGLSPGRGRLSGGRSGARALRRGRGRGGDHPGDGAGRVRPEHARTRRRLRRARPHRRLPALGHRAGRQARAAAHPLQERLRRAHGRQRADSRGGDAQPLSAARDLRAAATRCSPPSPGPETAGPP